MPCGGSLAGPTAESCVLAEVTVIETYGPLVRNRDALAGLSLINCCARKRAVLFMSLLPVLFLSIRARPYRQAVSRAGVQKDCTTVCDSFSRFIL
jgi:hypothetical protein